MIFSGFTQWYMYDGSIEDLDQFTKSEVIDGVINLLQIKNKMILHQKYEIAVHIRSLEKELFNYLMIEVNSELISVNSLPSYDSQYKYGGLVFNTLEECFSYIKTYEKRDVGLDKLL